MELYHKSRICLKVYLQHNRVNLLSYFDSTWISLPILFSYSIVKEITYDVLTYFEYDLYLFINFVFSKSICFPNFFPKFWKDNIVSSFALSTNDFPGAADHSVLLRPSFFICAFHRRLPWLSRSQCSLRFICAFHQRLPWLSRSQCSFNLVSSFALSINDFPGWADHSVLLRPSFFICAFHKRLPWSSRSQCSFTT